MNILITGIHGFVGSNLVAALHEQHAIYGLDIISPQKEGVVKTYGWEALYNKSLPEVDAIIHLAGKAHDTKNQAEAKTYFDINTGLTQKIYDYFLASSAKKFIFFSSVKAAADSVNGDMLKEDIVPSPKGPYGESKIAAENYILSKLPVSGLQSPVSRLQSPVSGLRTSDKKVFILRPCMIHGPGNKGNLNLLFNIVSKGIPWPLGAFENQRSFTSIDNLCFAINELISNEVPSGIYNMADDEPISTNRLIELIAESKVKKARIWKVNPKIISLVARFGDKIHLPLNSERLKKLTESYIVSNNKLKKALNIEKMPVSAEEGMRKTLRSF